MNNSNILFQELWGTQILNFAFDTLWTWTEVRAGGARVDDNIKIVPSPLKWLDSLLLKLNS